MNDFNAMRVLQMYEVALQLTAKQAPPNSSTTIHQQLSLLQSLKENPKYSTIIDFYAPGAPLDTLIALCEEGPLDDGDVPSKAERDLLVSCGYAVRISCRLEQGFNAATYKGNNAYAAYFNADTIKEARVNRILRKTLRKAGSKDK